MGDVAMCVPVLRALLVQYPHLSFTVLTKAFLVPFFRGLERVDTVVADVKGNHKGVLGLCKLAKTLNKTFQFDAIADLHDVLRSKILRQLIKSNQVSVIDKGRAEKKKLIKGVFFKPLKTTHQRYADVFSKLGYPVNLETPSFPKKVVLNAKLKAFIAGNGVVLGVAPFAAHEGKMYPLTQMKRVIATLSKSYNIVLFGGGEKEIKCLDAIAETHENIKSVAGQLSMSEELDVISNLDLMVAMDSGNAHIAAMLGVKVITIWGVTHPFAGFAPFHQPIDYALVADRTLYPAIPTSVYGNTYPEGYEKASESIPPEAIISKVNAVL